MLYDKTNINRIDNSIAKICRNYHASYKNLLLLQCGPIWKRQWLVDFYHRKHLSISTKKNTKFTKSISREYATITNNVAKE